MIKIEAVDASNPPSVYVSAAYGRAVAVAESGTWVIACDQVGDWQLPLILRQIPGTQHIDATTPYGYGGFHIAEHFSAKQIEQLWEQTRSVLVDRGVVSLFLRFPPFLARQAERAASLPGLNVRNVASTVLVSTGSTQSMWMSMHKRSRTAVRAAEKLGARAEVVLASSSLVEETRGLYESTMRRVGAADGYLFPDDYYHALSQLGDRLHIVRVLDGAEDCVAASFVLSDGKFAHYHLSGSTGTVTGANNLMLWELLQWSATTGLAAVHLGGGLSDGDSLFKFKASLGGEPAPFAVATSILNEELYEALTLQRARDLDLDPREITAAQFFPAYRVTA